jgi:hypothetical protein
MAWMLAGILILLVLTTAWAVPLWLSLDTLTLVAKSSDILIAQCTPMY